MPKSLALKKREERAKKVAAEKDNLVVKVEPKAEPKAEPKTDSSKKAEKPETPSISEMIAEMEELLHLQGVAISEHHKCITDHEERIVSLEKIVNAMIDEEPEADPDTEKPEEAPKKEAKEPETKSKEPELSIELEEPSKPKADCGAYVTEWYKYRLPGHMDYEKRPVDSPLKANKLTGGNLSNWDPVDVVVDHLGNFLRFATPEESYRATVGTVR